MNLNFFIFPAPKSTYNCFDFEYLFFIPNKKKGSKIEIKFIIYIK